MARLLVSLVLTSDFKGNENEMKRSVDIGPNDIGPNDVLLGRGGHSYKHYGNEMFRDLAQSVASRYINSSKIEKSRISKEMVNYVMSMNPPGRFLRRVGLENYEEVGFVVAREKASQCLRDAATALINSTNEKQGLKSSGNIHDDDGKKMDSCKETISSNMNPNVLYPLMPITTSRDSISQKPFRNIRTIENLDLSTQVQQVHQSDNQHSFHHASFPSNNPNNAFVPNRNNSPFTTTYSHSYSHQQPVLTNPIYPFHKPPQFEQSQYQDHHPTFHNTKNSISVTPASQNRFPQTVPSHLTIPSSHLTREEHQLSHSPLEYSFHKTFHEWDMESIRSSNSKSSAQQHKLKRSKSCGDVCKASSSNSPDSKVSRSRSIEDFELFYCRSTSHSLDSIDSFNNSL